MTVMLSYTTPSSTVLVVHYRRLETKSKNCDHGKLKYCLWLVQVLIDDPGLLGEYVAVNFFPIVFGYGNVW